MLAHQLAAAIEAVRPSQLDHLARTLWKGHGAGLVSAEDAQRLAEAIEGRRGVRSALHGAPRPLQGLFSPKRPQLARPHPERIGRRRRLAASSPLPAPLAAEWTTGELAVLRIVGDEVRERGTCDRSLAEIAARAGVCRSLAQATIRRAARAGLVAIEERPRKGAKNLPNVVRIVSREWLIWLKRGPKRFVADAIDAGAASIGSRKLGPTDTDSFLPVQNRGLNTRQNGFGGRGRLANRVPPNP